MGTHRNREREREREKESWRIGCIEMWLYGKIEDWRNKVSCNVQEVGTAKPAICRYRFATWCAFWRVPCACGIMRPQICFFIASPFELRKPHLNWWSTVFWFGAWGKVMWCAQISGEGWLFKKPCDFASCMCIRSRGELSLVHWIFPRAAQLNDRVSRPVHWMVRFIIPSP